jgi:uncharacterized protein YecT (DUF1311 family)
LGETVKQSSFWYSASLSNTIRLAICLVLQMAISAHAQSQNRNIAGCLSITDVDERIECLEGRVSAPPPATMVIPNQNPSRQRPTSIAPSFDCRSAATSIERAICSNELLSDWDARMGQAYQRAMRTGNSSSQLQENQRLWLAQRNRICGSGSEITQSCLLEITRQRVTALSEISANIVGDPGKQVSPALPQTGQVPQAEKNATTLPGSIVGDGKPSDAKSPSATLSSEGSIGGLFVVVLVLGGVAWGLVKIVSGVLRRRYLVAKYGEEIADKIIAKQVWQGMTNEQLTDSWGNPMGISQEVIRQRVKETWKYGQTGKNRFRNRIYLENGVVIGWKD